MPISDVKHYLWWPIATNQSNKNNNNKKKSKMKNKIKKTEKILKNVIQKKAPQNYHGPWVPNLIKFFYLKKKEKQNYHSPWVPSLIVSYQGLYIKDLFGSPLKSFHLEITILAVAELIEEVEEIKKNMRTCGCGTSRFQVIALWRGVTNLYFLQDKYLVRNFYFTL